MRASLLLALVLCLLGLVTPNALAGVPSNLPAPPPVAAPAPAALIERVELERWVLFAADERSTALLVVEDLRFSQQAAVPPQAGLVGAGGAAAVGGRETHVRRIALVLAEPRPALLPLAADRSKAFVLWAWDRTSAGWFLQNDPLLSGRASDHYAYANGQPTGVTDPMGLRGMQLWEEKLYDRMVNRGEVGSANDFRRAIRRARQGQQVGLVPGPGGALVWAPISRRPRGSSAGARTLRVAFTTGAAAGLGYAKAGAPYVAAVAIPLNAVVAANNRRNQYTLLTFGHEELSDAEAWSFGILDATGVSTMVQAMGYDVLSMERIGGADQAEAWAHLIGGTGGYAAGSRARAGPTVQEQPITVVDIQLEGKALKATAWMDFQDFVMDVAREVNANPDLLMGYLSADEQAAVRAGGAFTKAELGTAFQQLVAERIAASEYMSQRFAGISIGGRNPRTDFAGVGPYEGVNFELTTPRGVARHAWPFRSYGDDVEYGTYGDFELDQYGVHVYK